MTARPPAASPAASKIVSLGEASALHSADGGRIAENIMHFARTLRAAGLPVGPGRVLRGIAAVEAVGIRRRDDFYWALHAVFVNRRDQQELFDQAFHVFWRNPKILERMLGLLLPTIRNAHDDKSRELSQRLAEALRGAGRLPDLPEHEQDRNEIEIDTAMTFSDKEVLQTIDFETMTNEELARAKAAIAAMRLPIMELPTRRHRPARGAGQRADLRATMRAALRSGSDTIPLRWKRPRRRHPPLVVICDISGSMSRYSISKTCRTQNSPRPRLRSRPCACRSWSCRRGAPGPRAVPGSAPTCVPPCAPRCARARTPFRCAGSGRAAATRHWWLSATFPAR